MVFNNIKDIAIYGTDCIVDITRGADETCSFISAKEKYFDVTADNNGRLTVTQKKGNIFYRIIMRRFEFKLVLPKNFKGRLRFRNKNGGLYVKDCNFTDVELSTKNGKFDINKITCTEFSLKMRNGSVNLKNMTAHGNAFVKCTNGNIKVEKITAPMFNVSCQNIGLSATDVVCDKLDLYTQNGTIDASAIKSSDTRLETSNGKVTALILGSRDEHRLSLETTHGTITVDGTPCKNITDPDGAEKRVTARNSNGDLDLRFLP